MKINKKTAGVLILLGLVTGGAGMVAAQSHADQGKSLAPAAAITAPATVGDVVTPGDTDNIQDPGGVEQADVVDVKDKNDNDKSEKGEDANDSDRGSNEDAD